MVETNTAINNDTIMGCGFIQHYSIFKIGGVEIQHTGMKKTSPQYGDMIIEIVGT